MKFGRFLLGVAAGVAVSYVLVKEAENRKYVRPEQALQHLKDRCKGKLNIVGSWIHVEPMIEELNGIQYNIYQGGLTALENGTPRYLDFKVDADTGTILSLEN